MCPEGGASLQVLLTTVITGMMSITTDLLNTETERARTCECSSAKSIVGVVCLLPSRSLASGMSAFQQGNREVSKIAVSERKYKIGREGEKFLGFLSRAAFSPEMLSQLCLEGS